MEKASKIFRDLLQSNEMHSCTFSAPREKTNVIKSIHAKSVSNLNELKVEFRHQKHNDIKTILKSEFITKDLPKLLQAYKQLLIKSDSIEYQVLFNKKLVGKIIEKKSDIAHVSKGNRTKNYLIPDNIPCPFLIEIGVMEPSGKVKPNFYKKFKQINRFLELVDNLYTKHDGSPQHIIDFGCGKSYLTFAIYHYFKNVLKTQVKITGIDIKEEVIDHCNQLASKLNFSHLNFVHGQIHNFQTDQPIDFVITLHACDIATDDAILFSLKNNATQMMFVPCCQHELNQQLHNENSSAMLKHGILKDRLTAIITDSMRAQLLEIADYKVQCMEFIDLEHTAKNILLRCSKRNSQPVMNKEDNINKYLQFKNEWSINPYLEQKMKSLNYFSI